MKLNLLSRTFFFLFNQVLEGPFSAKLAVRETEGFADSLI